MKKILPGLVLGISLAILLVPLIAEAQKPPETCTLTRDLTDIDSACTKGASVSVEDYGMCCLINSLYRIADWAFVVLVIVAILFVLLGAYTFITSGGDPARVTSARNYLLYAIIGLVVAFLARAVPSIVKMLIGAT